MLEKFAQMLSGTRDAHDPVAFSVFQQKPTFLTHYNELGDTSLLSGAGCNSGGLWTIFCGLIVLVGYRKPGTR
ncbi:MAG: hypothetical protein LBF92_10675 [Synergistaceae bacterium]|jgi:hypothetical protein|nr:hypothetical protein [Synergistaceae bacterium]